MAREGIAQGGLDLQRQGFQWDQSKDRHQGIAQYLGMLREGRYADAEALGSTLSGLGVHIQPVSQPAGNAPSVEEWHSSLQGGVPQAPTPPPAGPPAPASQPLQSRFGGLPQDDRIDYSASNVDNIRAAPSEDDEMAAARARVAEIGGDTSQFDVPQQSQPVQPLPSMMGMGSGLPAPKPQGPGQVEIFVDGKHLGVVDVAKMAAEQRSLAEAEGKAFTSMLPTRFKPLMSAVEGAPNLSLLKDRTKNAMGVAEQLFAGERAQAMAQMKGAQMGMGNSRMAADDARALIKDEVAKTADARKRIDSLRSAIKLATSTNSLAERMALTQNLKAMFSSVTSDREMGFAMAAGGKLTDIERQINEWTEEGRLPADYLQRMNEASRLLEQASREVIQGRAKVVVDSLRADPDLMEALGPEKMDQYASIAYSRITGDSAAKSWKGRGGGGPSSVSTREGSSSKGLDPFTGEPPVPAGPAKPGSDLPSFMRPR